MTAACGIVVAYVIGMLVTFDLVGQRFDPEGPAVDVTLGCVITLAAAALWPLTAGLVLAERTRRPRPCPTAPKARSTRDLPGGSRLAGRRSPRAARFRRHAPPAAPRR